MKTSSEYAIVYDLRSDTERNRVFKILKGFGFPVQKSVFECRLDRKGKRELIRKLQALEIETGFIKVYRLEYRSKHSEIGHREKTDFDDDSAFVV